MVGGGRVLVGRVCWEIHTAQRGKLEREARSVVCACCCWVCWIVFCVYFYFFIFHFLSLFVFCGAYTITMS